MRIEVTTLAEACLLKRKQMGLKRAEMAEKLGWAKGLVKELERGRWAPVLPGSITKLSDVYELDRTWVWWMCMLRVMGSVPEDIHQRVVGNCLSHRGLKLSAANPEN